MKKIFATLAAVGTSAVVLAEGTLQKPTLDTGALEKISESIGDWGTAVLPFLLAVAGVFIGFYLLKVGIRLFKSLSGSR